MSNQDSLNSSLCKLIILDFRFSLANGEKTQANGGKTQANGGKTQAKGEKTLANGGKTLANGGKTTISFNYWLYKGWKGTVVNRV